MDPQANVRSLTARRELLRDAYVFGRKYSEGVEPLLKWLTDLRVSAPARLEELLKAITAGNVAVTREILCGGRIRR